MAYYDGFVIPVPTADKAKFVDHAERMDKVFLEYGALQVVEAWGDNIAPGKVTDFRRAVDAKDDESVAFSWVEWPDKATRDAAFKAMESNETMMNEPMPFDGKRMIFGGFEPIVVEGKDQRGAFVQGFVLPVRGKEAYRKMAAEAWPMFERYGALKVVECWQDDVPQGKQTDFYRAVKAEPGEEIVFSYMLWPSREVCDAASEKMQNDPEMKMPDDMPFDPQRMISRVRAGRRCWRSRMQIKAVPSSGTNCCDRRSAAAQRFYGAVSSGGRSPTRRSRLYPHLGGARMKRSAAGPAHPEMPSGGARRAGSAMSTSPSRRRGSRVRARGRLRGGWRRMDIRGWAASRWSATRKARRFT